MEELGGGVSSGVFRVVAGGLRLVVKQPFPMFRVQEEWVVDVERAAVEAEFLRRVGPRLRGAFPRFVAYDADAHVLVVEAAPASFDPWKARLLTGDADPSLGEAAGRLAARIHNLGLEEPALRPAFDRPTFFDQQRIDPYLRTVQRRHPEQAKPLQDVITHLERDRTTLVHGDFSPKNMLTDGHAMLLVDHEVATWNDPLFDVAFFLNHLLLKAVHRRAARARLRTCGDAFCQAYESTADARIRERWRDPSHLLPALMLARVDGKSPAEYLPLPGRDAVRRRALAWLAAPPRSTQAYVTAAFEP